MKPTPNTIEQDPLILAHRQPVSTHLSISPLKFLLWLLNGKRQTKFLLLATDLIAASASFGVAYWMASYVFRAGIEPIIFRFIFPLFIILLPGSLGLMGAYQSMTERRSERELEVVVKGVSLSFLLVFMTSVIFLKGWPLSRYFLLLWWVNTIILELVFRFLLRELYKSLWRRGHLKERALFIGGGDAMKRTLEHLALQRHHRFEYVGIVTENGFVSEVSELLDLPVLGDFKQTPELIRNFQVGRVFLFPDSMPHEKERNLFRYCQTGQVGVNVVSDIYSSMKEVTYDQYTGLLTIWSNGIQTSTRLNRFMKGALDLVGSFAGMLIFSFIYPVIALSIKLEDGGPVLYRRGVQGKNGNPFDAFKFRTMRVDADEILENNPELKAKYLESFKLEDDPRVTKVGQVIRKWSIDEFPQFLNVLKGQMSLVGPRMIVKEELDKYGANQKKLLSVKPGLTGFWQVSGRQTTDYEERARMDMFYIDHWSIWMDLMILIKTVWKVLKREGAL